MNYSEQGLQQPVIEQQIGQAEFFVENTNDVQVASNRGSCKITGQEGGVLQEMIWLDRNRAVTHVLTEPQRGIAMSFVSRFSGLCVELRPILKNFLLQLRHQPRVACT